MRLSPHDSQLMRALKRPRADHIEAHAVVSSSGEPEATDGRNFAQLKVHCIGSPQLALINQFRCNSSGTCRTPQDMVALTSVARNASICVYMTPR